jgi:histone-lysine N-methyltransferase SETMAR
VPVGYDNARPHTARLTLEKIEKMVWEILPRPPYSPDLAPSDCHLFGFVKNQMRGQNYETNETLLAAVRQCLRAAETEYSNFQHGGKNVCREMRIMWKNKQMSMD